MGDNVQLGVSTVMTGEVLQSFDGGEGIAMADMVVLIPYINGEQKGNYSMTPEQTMVLARALASAAGSLINREVDDNGAPLSPLAKLIKFGAL